MTAFCSPREPSATKVMLFGLKISGAIYQHVMMIIFNEMLENFIKCYVDDLVVKCNKEKIT